jgi:hypothetical protein
MKTVRTLHTPFCILIHLVCCATVFITGCSTPESPDMNRATAADSPAAENETDQTTDSQDEVPQVENEDSNCKKVPASLRNLYYSHFEKLAEGKDIQFRNDLAKRMAKLLGKTLKESSGNSASVTDMKMRGSSNSVRVFFTENSKYNVESSGHLKISLEGRRTLLNQSGVTMDKQTNFGLLQMSADRLYAQKNRDLYESFKEVILSGSSKGAAYCGSYHVIRGTQSAIQAELETAASCDEGYTSKSGILCFGKMMTICPALNIQLGLNAPAAYFATRKAAPKCSAAFSFLAASM